MLVQKLLNARFGIADTSANLAVGHAYAAVTMFLQCRNRKPDFAGSLKFRVHGAADRFIAFLAGDALHLACLQINVAHQGRVTPEVTLRPVPGWH